MELNINLIEMVLIYIIVICLGIYIVFFIIFDKVRIIVVKKTTKPNILCLKAINNEKLVTKYVATVLQENISKKLYKKMTKKIKKNGRYQFSQICKVGTDLQFKYNDEEINVQVGKLINIIALEYQGDELYSLTRNENYQLRNWKKIITEAEQKCEFKTNINVVEIPFEGSSDVK